MRFKAELKRWGRPFVGVLLSGFMLLGSGCASDGRAPKLSDLDSAIRDHVMFQGAPLPKVAALSYRSSAYPSGTPYSRYTIYPQRTIGSLTEYRTVEIPPTAQQNLPQTLGEGVGYGGIFMLLYRKHGQLPGNPRYYRQYAMFSVDKVQGHLFPLKAGNELSFDAHALMRYRGPQQVQQSVEDGRFLYQVLSCEQGYDAGYANVPGKVCAVRVSYRPAGQVRGETKYVYYFSERLGWYVGAQYYQQGKVAGNYRVTAWR